MADFAAAQKRIVERRARHEEILTAAEAQHREARNDSLLRLPPALRSLAFESVNLYDTLRNPDGTRPAFRVGQVDAELLDEALLDLLQKQTGEGLKLYGAHLKDDWNAEITVLLRTLLWKLSIWDHGATYGATLQGLKYTDARGLAANINSTQQEATKWQRGCHGLITVGGKYFWTRWEDYLSSQENGYDEPTPFIQRLSRITTVLSNTHNVAAFLSFLVFLYNGKYRTLTDRILRLRLIPSTNQTSREVSFEFLNRQLVWHAFTEFLLFLLPLVGISRWRRWLARAWKRGKAAILRLRTGTSASSNEDDEDFQKGELGFLPERTCAICYQDQNPTGGQSEQDVIAGASSGANSGIIGSAMTDITNPYETVPCGCIYCFVCLAQKIESEEGEGWTCLRCGEVVKECQPWNGDVVPERTEKKPRGGSFASDISRVSRKKSVVFDLQDDEDERERRASTPLSAVDPRPLEDEEEELQWSRVEEVSNDGDSFEDDDG